MFDRGVPTRKLVHQLVVHPRPDLQPAGAGEPDRRRLHGQGRRDRARATPTRRSSTPSSGVRGSRWAAMTAAKLLSAVEPVLRYQRQRFRGADGDGARHAAPRPRPPAARGRASPPRGRLGDRRGGGVAGVRGGAPLRRTRRPRAAEDEPSSRSGAWTEARRSCGCSGQLRQDAVDVPRGVGEARRDAERGAVPAARRRRPRALPRGRRDGRRPVSRPRSCGTPATAPP